MEKTFAAGGKRKSLFQAPTPSKAPALEEEEKRIFGKQKSPFPGCGLSKQPTLQIHPKEWLSASKNHLFKSWPLLTTHSGRTSTNFPIKLHHHRCVQAKSKQLRPYVGHICQSYRIVSSLSFCLKIKLKDIYIYRYIYINSKCQYPRFLHNLKSPIFRQTHT